MDVGMPQSGTRSALELECAGGTVNDPEAGLMTTPGLGKPSIRNHPSKSAVEVIRSFFEIFTVLDGQGKENLDKARLLGEYLL
jgi:hypothetical protein